MFHSDSTRAGGQPRQADEQPKVESSSQPTMPLNTTRTSLNRSKHQHTRGFVLLGFWAALLRQVIPPLVMALVDELARVIRSLFNPPAAPPGLATTAEPPKSNNPPGNGVAS